MGQDQVELFYLIQEFQLGNSTQWQLISAMHAVYNVMVVLPLKL